MNAGNTPAVRVPSKLATLDEIDAFLNYLHRHWNDDPEQAHALADEIKTRVLELVAEGSVYARLLAEKVLEIDSWGDVKRWCA